MISLSAFADEYSNRLEEQIEALRQNSINLIELRNADGENVTDFSAERAAEVKKRLDAAAIKVWAVGSALGKDEIDVDEAQYLKKVERVCANAVILGAERVRVFSFFHAYKERERVIELLSKMTQIASRHGVKLCHENEKEIYGDSPDRVADLHAHVKQLGLVYDPANYVQCGENVEEALKKLGPVTDYFHCKDVLLSGEIVPAGEGDAHIAEMIEAIEGDKVITVEPHLAAFEGYSKIDATEMKNKYAFKSTREAFNAGVAAVKKMLEQCGYREAGYNRYKKDEAI